MANVVELMLGLLPFVLVAGLLAIPLGAAIVLLGLLDAASGGGAPSWSAYSGRYAAHEHWARARVRRRFLAGVLRDQAAIRVTRPFTPEDADAVRAYRPLLRGEPKSANRAAVRGPVRIGPVPVVATASAGRVASPRAERGRSPRASASARARRSARSSRSPRPTRR